MLLKLVDVRTAALRRLAYAGARYGPRPWVEFSPAFFGVVFAALLPAQRAVVRDNLRRLGRHRGPWGERLDVVKTFVAYAHCLAESLAMERPDAQRAEPLVHGAEHLATAIGEGRGVVIVTAHTGAWDAAARWLGRDYAADVLVVMAAESNDRARELHDGARTRAGIRVLHVGRDALDALPLLGHLRRGGIVALQLDRPGDPATAIDVSLPDGRFLVPEGPFRLAMLARAPVVPIFARRTGYFRYEIDVRPGIRLPRRASIDEVSRAATLATQEMNRFLRNNPTEWFHFGR